MDPRLLDYYSRELFYMQELAAEFAGSHKKIAKRLGMQAGEIADPYVERLIQASSFISAHTQMKIDAAFPRFTQRLLEVTYPNYVSPIPSMAVARLFPGDDEGDLLEGFRVPRGADFISPVQHGEKSPCEFRSSQDVTLWPLEIVSAKLTAVPPDIPAIDRYVPNGMPVCGALRLTLRTTGQMKIADLRGLDRLPLYLTGDERIASRLFELLHVSALATVIAAPGSLGARDMRLHAVTRNAVVHEGLTSSECMLPSNGERFQSHNLLLEYFACPSRFYFFTLTGLAPGLQQIEGREAEVIVLLRASTTELADRVDASQFALFCTPVINLFPLEIDAVELPASGAREVHLKPVGARSQDYELFSVAALHGHLEAQSERFEFMPLYSSFINDENNHGRHYTIRRERRLMPPSSRRYGTRAPYISTEVFVSIVDGDEMPYSQPMNYLSAQVLATNRDLPNLLDCNGRDDLALRRSSPVATVGLVRAPSLPRPPCADGDVAWQLIRQMNFTYLSLENLPGRPSGEGLRQMLRLFPASDDVRHRQQIESITGVRTEPVTRRLPGNGELVFGRGIACYLDIDETGFDGISPYLFGLVLDHYLARHVSIHSFTQTELRSAQRGTVVRGPVRMGTRGAV